MMSRVLPIAAVLVLLAGPAFAQFPPPGIYACVDAGGASVGTLTLFVAGDYQFKSASVDGKGQVASAGPSVNAISGPLADVHLSGSFSTDARGEAVFVFDTDGGKWQCSLPAL